MPDARRLVDKLWSDCHVLHGDGAWAIEYVEQLTYLLFERWRASGKPGRFGWSGSYRPSAPAAPIRRLAVARATRPSGC